MGGLLSRPARYAQVLYLTAPPARPVATETRLAELENAAPVDNDPAPLDALPAAAGTLDHAPVRIKEALLAAFQVQALYNNNDDQVTIRSTLTADTPRTDDDTPADPRRHVTFGTRPYCAGSGPRSFG